MSPSCKGGEEKDTDVYLREGEKLQPWCRPVSMNGDTEYTHVHTEVHGHLL